MSANKPVERNDGDDIQNKKGSYNKIKNLKRG